MKDHDSAPVTPREMTFASDSDSVGERWYRPGLENPPGFPPSAIRFFAAASIRLASEGLTEEAYQAWPFPGAPEEYLDNMDRVAA